MLIRRIAQGPGWEGKPHEHRDYGVHRLSPPRRGSCSCTKSTCLGLFSPFPPVPRGLGFWKPLCGPAQVRAVPTGRYPARPLAQDSDSPQDWGVEMQRSRRKSPGIAGKEGSVPSLDVELGEARVSGLSSREGEGASEHAVAEGAPHPPTAPLL